MVHRRPCAAFTSIGSTRMTHTSWRWGVGRKRRMIKKLSVAAFLLATSILRVEAQSPEACAQARRDPRSYPNLAAACLKQPAPPQPAPGSGSPEACAEARKSPHLYPSLYAACWGQSQAAAAPAASTNVDAATEADELIRLAQERLESSYLQQPFTCMDGWVSGPSGFLLQLSPWAESAGLKRGDRLLQIGAVRMSGSVDWEAAMRQLPAEADFEVHVERAGRQAQVRLPCRDHRPYLSAERSLWEAITARNWDACIRATEKVSETFGAASSFPLELGIRCSHLTRDKPNQEQLMAAIYRLGSLMVDEVRFVGPSERALMRSRVVEIIVELEQRGYSTYANDLRKELDRRELPASAERERAPSSGPTPTSTTTRSTGTGFLVSPTGDLLTALHVVEGASLITVTCGDSQKTFAASLVKKSAALDLALLKLATSGRVPYLAFAPASSELVLGRAVFTVGYPASNVLGTDAKFTEGTISGLSGLDGDTSFLQVSVPVQPGNSGGALMTENGEIVGVILATADAPTFLRATGSLPQNINWAVKGELVRTMVSGLPGTIPARTRQEAIQKATAASCMITATTKE
jgi:S1-C subfamily serine protease